MTARRAATIGGIGVAALVAVALVATVVLWTIQRGSVLPNTSVAGIDVSGLDGDEVRTAIAPKVERRETDPVVFTFEGEEHHLVPVEVGYRIDVDATVDAALGRGRQGLPGDVLERIRSLRVHRDLELVEGADGDQIVAWVDDLADRLDREERTGSIDLDPDSGDVEVVRSQGEVIVRRDDTLAAAKAALLADGPDLLDLPAETTEQPIDNAEIDALADIVRRAVDGPLELSAGDGELTLSPRDLALLLDVRTTAGGQTGTTLDLVVTADAVDAVMGEVAPGRFDVAPVDARYTASRTPPRTFDPQSDATFSPVSASVTIEEGRAGARFDQELAATQLTELLRQGARKAELRLEAIEAAFPNEVAEELLPTHVIGTFTTYYTAGQVRNTNIQKLADVVDGTLVLPGEQFSINAISGARTCEKGYEPAGTIVRGELVDTCGGGTSQFGTTTFNAAFFSGVQLDQWRAHSWYISRYPMGREATLSFPELDVKFTNTTDGAILVKTAHTPTSVTVSLYGQPRARSVSARHGAPSNPRDFSTDVRTTAELVVGQERVLQGGFGGFSVEVVRTVDLIDGGTEQRTIRTVYVPQTRIVERGTRPAPQPDPEPEPDEDDDEDDD